MSGDIAHYNRMLRQLQKNLIEQLQTTEIEYIDLLAYYNQVNNIKIAKNTAYLEIVTELH